MTRPLVYTPEKLNAFQKLWRVLDVLARRGHMPTYVIRNWLTGYEGEWPGATTSQVLAVCKRAERVGFVEQARSSYATMKVWRITNAGKLIALRGKE